MQPFVTLCVLGAWNFHHLSKQQEYCFVGGRKWHQTYHKWNCQICSNNTLWTIFLKMPMDEMQNTLYKMVIERNSMREIIDVTKKIPKLMQICIAI
jgi:hypothetical protein